MNTIEPSALVFVGIFFLIFFLTSFFLLLYLLNNVRRSFLGSVFLSGILILQALGLRELVYPVLLISLLLSIEFYFVNSRR